MSLLIPNLFIFAQILNCIMSSIIITPLLLFQNTQFPHTRRSPHNVQHSSSTILIFKVIIVVWISPTHSTFQAFRWDESLVTWPVSFPKERGVVFSLDRQQSA